MSPIRDIDPTMTYRDECQQPQREGESWLAETYSREPTALDDLRSVLVGITSELTGVCLAADGEVVRRIGALVIEGRTLIAQLEAEGEDVIECKCATRGANE